MRGQALEAQTLENPVNAATNPGFLIRCYRRFNGLSHTKKILILMFASFVFSVFFTFLSAFFPSDGFFSLSPGRILQDMGYIFFLPFLSIALYYGFQWATGFCRSCEITRLNKKKITKFVSELDNKFEAQMKLLIDSNVKDKESRVKAYREEVENKGYACPLSYLLMIDPVMADTTKKTYERTYIEVYNHNRTPKECPLTRENYNELISNEALKKEIEKIVDRVEKEVKELIENSNSEEKEIEVRVSHDNAGCESKGKDTVSETTPLLKTQKEIPSYSETRAARFHQDGNGKNDDRVEIIDISSLLRRQTN